MSRRKRGLRRYKGIAGLFVFYIRSQILFCAFDMPSDIERDKLIKSLYSNNVMILGSGDKSIRFRPNLNIKHEEIDFGLDALNKSLKFLLK